MHRYFITLLFLIPTLFADTSNIISIDAQIAAIKSAKPSERVALMNAFKVRVSQMNQQERSNVIAAMQANMHSQPHTQDIEHTSQMQLQESINVSHYQNINQTQVANQITHSSTETRVGITPGGDAFTQHSHK